MTPFFQHICVFSLLPAQIANVLLFHRFVLSFLSELAGGASAVFRGSVRSSALAALAIGDPQKPVANLTHVILQTETNTAQELCNMYSHL